MGDSNQRGPDSPVLRDIVEYWAAKTPDAAFAVFSSSEKYSYAEYSRLVSQTGRALQELGVKQGDHVLVWLPNGHDCIRSWLAINHIGAVYAPLNIAYRGKLLEHAISVADAAVAIVHPQLAPRLADIDCGPIRKLILTGDADIALDGIEILSRDALDHTEDALPLPEKIEPWHTQMIVFTSGTTGPSKGVLCSYAHCHFTALGVVSDRHDVPYLDSSDRYMITTPLFHIAGTAPALGMMILGGSIAITGEFNTSEFWAKVRETESSIAFLMGVMASFLIKTGDLPDPSDMNLRHILLVPLDTDGMKLGKAMGVTTHTLFNMTETCCPIIAEPNQEKAGSCGQIRDGVEARLVDENDYEVPEGEIGELIVRTNRPWHLNHGYYRNPEATARAWRNGWFHTGDAFRRTPDGYYYFVDRLKDAIRRRGENVSSFEVEAEVCGFPAVREAAAVAVRSEHGEDDILIAVSASEGADLNPAELLEYLLPRMAHFMVPRYVRIVKAMPRTPTNKIEKYKIRQEGVTADTWDREAAGIEVKRQRLG
ncbi:MAG: AMP-binding protein [Rhodobiaceae bacterium]|nr:AMP-binding protein [Rhodobiaceae bacterium]MCC0057416.1 AMP-binding protein [Rhodobiaceae bacterium]